MNGETYWTVENLTDRLAERSNQLLEAVEALRAVLPWVDEVNYAWMNEQDIVRRDVAIRKAHAITLGEPS